MAKLVLSEKEWNTVQNFDFLLTKNGIIDKVQHFFSHIGKEYITLAQPFLRENNSAYFTIAPKVSKGEKYEGLPYLMLDYPRFFQNGNTFAIRTFFLWGKTFSISLLLEGDCKQQLQTKVFENKKLKTWQYEVENSPWIHYKMNDECNPFSTITALQMDQHSFLKLSKNKPLDDWQNIETFFLASFHTIMEACFG